MAEDIVWEDPPRRVAHGGRRRAIWPARLHLLREHSHKWARIHGPVSTTCATSTASNLRTGKLKGFDPAEFNFVSRTVDGEGFVYARYIGNGTS